MSAIVYLLALLGAYRVVRRFVIIGHWFWKTRKDKPTPWFPARSPMRGIHP